MRAPTGIAAGLTAALSVALCASAGRAQGLQAQASVSPEKPRAGEPFQLTVRVVESSGRLGGALGAPSISWPDWDRLGLARLPSESTSTGTTTVGGRTTATTSVTIGLQARAEGTVEIPPIVVTGVGGSAETAPLKIVVEGQASMPPPIVPTPPGGLGPQNMPVVPWPSPHSAPGWGPGVSPLLPLSEPSPPPESQPTARERAAERLQMAVGAFAFLVLVIALVLGAVKWKSLTSRPATGPGVAAPGADATVQRLTYLMQQADPRAFYLEVSGHVRVQLGRIVGMDLSGRATDEVLATIRGRVRDGQLLGAVAECLQSADRVVGSGTASQADAARHIDLVRYLCSLGPGMA